MPAPRASGVYARTRMSGIATPALATFGGDTMGTTWSVKCVAPRHDLHALHRGVQAVLDDVVAQMSHWVADSAISRFNRAPQGWHALPGHLYAVLRFALDIARDCAGAFDPTIGELVRLWGFGPQPNTALPPDNLAIDAARARCGWTRLTLRDEDCHAFQPGGMQLDLSAIAKGYAVDRVSGQLQAQGVDSLLVEIGGELFGTGRKPDGSPWRVLVEHDPYREEAEADPPILQLDGLAVATSGDRWHRHTVNGRTHAHTLDPRSGRPLPQAPANVTVIADSAMRADALATALSVLGADAGMAWARARGIAGRFLLADGALRATPDFHRHVVA